MDAIVTLDENQRIVVFNPAAERMFGYSSADVLGHSIDRLLPQRHRKAHRGHIGDFGRSGVTNRKMAGRPVTGLRASGEEFPAEATISQTRSQERLYTVILRDITERQQAEALIREQQTLASLGQMAAVVAHEVRNPLAAIKGVVQVLGARKLERSKEKEVLAEVVERLDTLNALIDDLLVFARPTQPRFAPLALLPVLEGSAQLLELEPALSGISIEVTGPESIVNGDATLLQRLFHNLLLNAAHAMDGRGIIRVEVAPGDNTCELRIRDTGPGIPPDVRDRVFEPSFTTKSRGTGLGLSIAKRGIEHHQGTISLDCPAEGGTVVTIVLPLEHAHTPA